ncbi:MAG: hypothetical protein V1879_05135 [Pseudomonadota bacterium]
MTSHPEHERTRGASDDEDDGPDQSAGSTSAKLKVVSHYLMLGFAPAVAVIALVVAAVAISANRASQSRLNEVAAELQAVQATLAATRSEMENEKFIISRQKAQPEAGKMQEELNARIVQNVTRLQEKLKVSPTLEEQLHQSASAPVATPAPAAHPASASPVAAEKKTDAAPAPKPKASHSSAAPTAPAKAAAKVPEQKAAPKAATPAAGSKQTPAQLQAIKEAIEKFNRK